MVQQKNNTHSKQRGVKADFYQSLSLYESEMRESMGNRDRAATILLCYYNI